jgi:hypothetical protein
MVAPSPLPLPEFRIRGNMDREININGKVVKIKENLIATSRGIPTLRGDILNWLSRIGIEKEYVSIEYSGSLHGSCAEVT